MSQEIAYQQSVATASESLKCFYALLAVYGEPRSIIDLGCGNGNIITTAARLGIKATGFDLNLRSNFIFPNGSLIKHDITEPFPWKQYKADMVLCWELAEHLPEEFASGLIEIIKVVTNEILIFTAATPGQGGAGHINEKPHAYWRGLLIKNGLHYKREESITLSQIWEWSTSEAWWYSKNVQVFRWT